MESIKPQISIIEASNAVAARMENADKEYDSIFAAIMDATADLTNPEIPSKQKYDAIVSIEYLLVRARLSCEFEHLKVKSLISKAETPASLKSIFMKRDQYLAQVSLKLNAIREDIATLQKVVYVQSTRNVK